MSNRRSLTLALAVLLAGCQATTPVSQPAAAGLATLHGTVDAAPGSRVEIEGGAFQAEVTVGADHTFSAQVPAGGLYDVTAIEDDGQGKLKEALAIADAQAADVDLGKLVPQETGSIRGLVKLSDGGSPAGAGVFIPGTHLIGAVGPDGRFALDDLPAGDWTIVVLKPGYQPFALGELTVEAGSPLVIGSPITLVSGNPVASGLKAVLKDSKGQPVVGGQLTAIAAGGETYEAAADAQGNLQLANLPAGTYQVNLYHPFMALPATRTVAIADGATLDLGAITMDGPALALGTIAGQVTDEAGKPVAGAAVRLDPPGSAPVVADATGHFSFNQVEAGEYTVSATAAGFDPADRGVVLDNAPAATAHVDQGLVLRAPVATPMDVLPPEVTVERSGDDLKVKWEAEGTPPGASLVDYQLEGEVAPGVYAYLGHTTGTELTLQGYGASDANLRVTATATEAASTEAYVLTQVQGGIHSASTVIAADLKGMDLETALLAVQTSRANLLEGQLADLAAAVKAKNVEIAKLNQILGIFRRLQARFSDRAEASQTMLLTDNERSDLRWNSLAADYFGPDEAVTPPQVFNKTFHFTKGRLDAAIAPLAPRIDALASGQQLEMLRLQALSSKRNEAFDTMTNFLKKMADNRASILGNMR